MDTMLNSLVNNDLNHYNEFIIINEMIAEAKRKVFQAVNNELISLYWNIGEYLHKKVNDSNWGKSVISELSAFILKTQPNIKGFSAQNLWRMKQFYETYKDNPKLATLWREISWSHHKLIMPCKSEDEREFYIRLTIKERLSVRELERQINTSYYERVMLGNIKLKSNSNPLMSDANNTFKDTYVLELLNLPQQFLEKDLRKAISKNITKFLLEFGRDFAFMGEQYPLQVGNQDFEIDLLFYNRKLNCLVAVELKIEKFKPEQIGQLNFYLEALDRDIKTESENPSIGILLCAGKDDTVVEYSLNRSLSPTLVADYQTKLPNKRLLQQKWEEILGSLKVD